MIEESILELHETNARDETIKSYEYDEYQPITGTQRYSWPVGIVLCHHPASTLSNTVFFQQ